MKASSDITPNPQNKSRIDVNNFKIIKEIHTGSSSSIYSVQNNKNEKYFAAKIIKGENDSVKIYRMFNYDFNNIIRCQHPTLINYHGYSPVDFKGEKNLTMIMDLASNSPLSHFVDKAQNGVMNRYYKSARQIILIGIARGMMYLHEHHILHRNLNSSNVFLDEHYRPLIANYGLAKFSKVTQQANQDLTYQKVIYMAPEVLSKNLFNIKSDVYSFGIIMYEILTDSTPYPLFQKGRMTTLQFIRKIVNEDYRPKFTTPIRKSFKNLIERCLSKNPHDRPSFEDIFNMLAYNIEDINFNPLDEKDDNDHNYYIESIDTDEVFTYIDLITKNDANNYNESLKSTIDDLKKDNELLKNDNEQLRQQIGILKKQNIQLAKKYEEFYIKDIVPLKKDNEELKKLIERQQQQLTAQKPKRPEIPPLVLQKREEKPVVVEVEEEDEESYNSNSIESISINDITSSATFDDSTETSSIKNKHDTKHHHHAKKHQKIAPVSSTAVFTDLDTTDSKPAQESYEKKRRDQFSSSSDSSSDDRKSNIISQKKQSFHSSDSSDAENTKIRRRRGSLTTKDSINATLRRVPSKSDTEEVRESYSPKYLKQSFRLPIGAAGKTSETDDEEETGAKSRTLDSRSKTLKASGKPPLKKNERNSINEREFYYLKQTRNVNANTINTIAAKKENERKSSPTSKKTETRLNSPSLNKTTSASNSPNRKASDEDNTTNKTTTETQRKFFSPRYKPELLLHLQQKKAVKEEGEEKTRTPPHSPSPKPTPLIKKYEKLTNDDERGPSSPRKKNDIYSEYPERGLSSPRKKIEEERSINSARKRNEEEKTVNSPRLNSARSSIRTPKTPKDDEEREQPLSPRNRSNSINNKEENYEDYDEQVLHSPRFKPPPFNETNIALDRFNALPLKFQKTFISELIQKTPNKIDQDLILIKELLRYLLQFNPSINSIHYFSLSTNKSKDSYSNVNEWCQDINEIHLLSAATEILYLNKSLDSKDFIDIIKQFSSVSIEIKYPSENFDGIFEIVTNIKNSQITKLKLAVSISGLITSDDTFRKNKDINSVKLDSTVQNIGRNSFRNCSNLVYVSISPSIKIIGNDAFRKCTSLVQITLPSSVTSIDEGAFSKCSQLRSINIPTSVTYIGEWAFNECSSLTKISLPDSVSQIGEWAFSGCSALKQFTIPKLVTAIGVSTFADCSSLTKLIIPSSVTVIGNWAFCKCSSLVSVSLPSSLVSIGEGAFSKCFALIDIEIPSKIKIIRVSTFAECSSLESVTVPSSVTTIEEQAFSGCFSLNEVSLPRSVTSIGFFAFPSNTVINTLD